MHMCTKPLLHLPSMSGSSMRANACVFGKDAPQPKAGAWPREAPSDTPRAPPTNCATFKEQLHTKRAPRATAATCVPRLVVGAEPACVEWGLVSAR